MKMTNETERLTKNLLMRAWRERWTQVQWGIHVKEVCQLQVTNEDEKVMADCILQQALIGPGPNALVLSYLVHSVFSQIVSTASVLRSVSKYDGYHKPFCITSLLQLLDTLKERLIVGSDCLELAMSVQATIHWLLACMYSSLENLSDLTNTADSNGTIAAPNTEDTRIVGKCRELIGFMFTDPYVAALLQIANAADLVTLEKIEKMCREVGKFSGGPHKKDIVHVTTLIGQSKKITFKLTLTSTPSEGVAVNGGIQSTIMSAALLKSSADIPHIVTDLLTIKELKNLSNADLICELIHSTMIGLIDALGTDSEVRFLGFTFLQLPSLLAVLREHLNDPADLMSALEIFITNESTLDVIDAKLHAGECNTLELFLSALSKISLLTKEQKTTILAKKGGSSNSSSNQPKQNSSNAMLILKAETTLLSVLKTLDGDYSKNQDAILGVLSEMFRAKSFELILTASSATGRLEQVTSRLLKLNQASRMVTGEGNKASATRALIFDISFLSLCYIVQHFGIKSLDFDTSSSFFTEWARECMVEGITVKSPDRILARCDQNKVDLLLNTYLQPGGNGGSDAPELKTSLVFWHELATNAVGVVRELILAWENGAIAITEVKRILDTLRSKVCSVPVSVAAWLCSYIQVMREEDCGKARYLLNHFLTPFSASEDNGDNFKERCAMMNSVISKMMISIQSTPSSTTNPNSQQCISETRPTSELLSPCWTSMASKGILDVETTLAVNRILQLSPPSLFVQLAVQELFTFQNSQDLVQWSDLIYGILHFNLESCANALFTHVLPNLLLFSSKIEFIEPQLSALVSLSVEIALSLHLHSQAIKVKVEVTEPSAKRRKINQSSRPTLANELLSQLYGTFGSVLAQRSSESRPQAVFILRFLEQLAAKNSSLINLLPHKTAFHLLRLLGNEISPSLLPSLFPLGNAMGRKACADAISFLKINKTI